MLAAQCRQRRALTGRHKLRAARALCATSAARDHPHVPEKEQQYSTECQRRAAEKHAEKVSKARCGVEHWLECFVGLEWRLEMVEKPPQSCDCRNDCRDCVCRNRNISSIFNLSLVFNYTYVACVQSIHFAQWRSGYTLMFATRNIRLPPPTNGVLCAIHVNRFTGRESEMNAIH